MDSRSKIIAGIGSTLVLLSLGAHALAERSKPDLAEELAIFSREPDALDPHMHDTYYVQLSFQFQSMILLLGGLGLALLTGAVISQRKRVPHSLS